MMAAAAVVQSAARSLPPRRLSVYSSRSADMRSRHFHRFDFRELESSTDIRTAARADPASQMPSSIPQVQRTQRGNGCSVKTMEWIPPRGSSAVVYASGTPSRPIPLHGMSLCIHYMFVRRLRLRVYIYIYIYTFMCLCAPFDPTRPDLTSAIVGLPMK